MSRTITVTIDEEGNQVFLKGHGADVFLGLGDTRTQRASHVEPDNRLLRFLFRALRLSFGDAGHVSQWTRGWQCLWRVDTRPTAGTILEGRWRNRQQAIDAEIEFLNEWFLVGEK